MTSAADPSDPTGRAATGAVAAGDAERAAHLLALVLERSPRTPGELADALATDAAEVRRLVDALERRELVASDAAGALIRPGPAELRFARSRVRREELLELAQPSMRRLADESGETANLFLPLSSSTEAIAQIDGQHVLGATNWIGRELALHCTAAGKVFLAFGGATVPDGELERLTPATITDRERLDYALGEVRENGYATLVDELEPGLSAVAAPVRDRGGTVIAALTASGPTLRLAPQRLRVLGRLTLEQAHALSARLGWEGALEDYPWASNGPLVERSPRSLT
jgi:IclR family acetate operon transcriptional repressor